MQQEPHGRDWSAPQGTAAVLPVPRTAGRRRLLRVLSWFAIGLSSLVLAVAGGGYLLVGHYDDNIDRIPGLVGAQPAPKRAGPKAERPLNVLLVGSDSREGLAPDEAFQGTGREFVRGQRSDTVILAHVYADGRRVQLVSFPRDSYVTIPAYTDPDSGRKVAARSDKLNEAFSRGGPKLLIATIQGLTGLRVDHYVQVDFRGFKRLVDALGGVEVCLTEAQREVKSGIDLPAGRQVVRGEQALAFVRQRQGLARGDVDRVRRQQLFLGSVVRKTLSAGTLLNPVRLNGVLGVVTTSLSVDETLTLDRMRRLALRVRRLEAADVAFTTVPIDDVFAVRKGKSVVLLDDAAGDALFDSLKRDVPPGTPTPGVTVPAKEVTVQVLNGAGVAGLARRGSTDLAAVGFRVSGSPADSGTGATGTVVRYGPGQEEAAKTVVASIAGATAQADPSLGSTLQVVLGSSYRGAVPVVAKDDSPAPSDDVTAADRACA